MTHNKYITILILITVLLLSAIACDIGDSSRDAVDPDKLAITQTIMSLNQTQAALEDIQSQPTEVPPTQAPPTEAPPTEAPPTPTVEISMDDPMSYPEPMIPGIPIYFNDFSYDDDMLTVGDTGGDSPTYYSIDEAQDIYIIENNRSWNTAYITVEEDDYKRADVRVEAEGTITEGDGDAGLVLVCRWTDAGYYDATVFSDGRYMIEKYDNGSFVSLIPETWHSAISTGWNSILFQCEGNTLSLYVNYEFVDSIVDYTFSGSGESGLGVISSPNQSRAVGQYSYFMLSVPPQ